MDFYQVVMKGKIWIEKNTVPACAWSSADEGRILYDTSTHSIYYADDAAWRNIGIPSGTNMVFYQDTAPTGWTLVNTVDDTLVYFTKGSANGGNAGGASKTSSTWTQPNHTHTGPSHTHTTGDLALSISQMPAHTHTLNVYGRNGSGLASTGTEGYAGAPTTSSTGSGAVHNHGATGTEGTGATSSNATANSWRPSGYCVIICTKN